MKTSNDDLMKLLKDENGNLLTDTAVLLKRLGQYKQQTLKKQKQESVKRRIIASRRATFAGVGMNGKVSYDAMTAYVWEYAAAHVASMRSWLVSQHPDRFPQRSTVAIYTDEDDEDDKVPY